MSSSSGPPPLRMSGLTIDFPFKPYPAQLALMDRLLKAITTKQHALLESPTGSGKTMALLCSVLAWHKKHKQELIQQAALKEMQQQELAGAATTNDIDEARPYDPFASTPAPTDLTAAVDPLTPAPAAASSSSKSSKSSKKANSASSSSSSTSSSSSVKIPKVYFSSRTHTQLAQIVAELKTTQYKPTMSILGSRQHYCIHPDVSQSTNKNDDCQKLLDFNECRYHRQLLTRPDLQPGGRHQVWDIEDLVALGERAHGCPYFAARQIAELPTTELVLCPYNYLIDPLIRKAMSIDLEGAIIIIDEAHNVEDVSRNAASREIDLSDLKHTELELTRLIESFIDEGSEERKTHFVTIRKVISELIMWIQDTIPNIRQQHTKQQTPSSSSSQAAFKSTQTNQEMEQLTLTGDDCLGVLSRIGVTPTSLKSLLRSIQHVCTKPQDSDKLEPHINGIATKVLESLGSVWEFMMSTNLKYIRDYRLVLRRDRQQNSTSASGARPKETFILCFWCLNPSVAFSSLASSARSVILTSGTLSPMDSFASELGVPFTIRLEAPHVIDRSQIFASILARGPNGLRLNASFKHADDITFQDELGQIVEDVAGRTPSGILIFFPSYAMIEKMTGRWKDTKLWKKISQTKFIIIEPKGTGNKFDMAMERFLNANMPQKEQQHEDATSKKKRLDASRFRASPPSAIDVDADGDGHPAVDVDDDDLNSTPTVTPAASSSSSSRVGVTKFVSRASATQTGAIFLAVNRGKLSEGIDFADYQARAVIVVGIPYPNSKDSKVTLKRSHNDEQKRASNAALLTGAQWYALQAYRSVNQAIGRAIRHRWDYGAIYLVDERYLDAKIQHSLSKWIQPSLMQVPVPYKDVLSQTDAFFAKWVATPPAPPPGVNTTTTTSATHTPTHNDTNQKTMAHFFTTTTNNTHNDQPHATRTHTPPITPYTAPAPAGTYASVPPRVPPAASVKHDLIDLDSPMYVNDDDDGDGELIIPLPPKPPVHAASNGSHDHRDGMARTKIEIAYQHEINEEIKQTMKTAVTHPPAVVDASAAASSTAALSSTMSAAQAALPPSHLSLHCRHCASPMAALPIVQAVVNAPPYHQTITESYFTNTVGRALERFRPEGTPPLVELPTGVAALVCSSFALEPTDGGVFGWIGYPCAVPDGMPPQQFLADQFYNIWSCADQICYQPLCCSILADRRDCTLEFEESCWIAKELITIKTIYRERNTNMNQEQEQADQTMNNDTIRQADASPARHKSNAMSRSASFALPLSHAPVHADAVSAAHVGVSDHVRLESAPSVVPPPSMPPMMIDSAQMDIPSSMPPLESRMEIEEKARGEYRTEEKINFDVSFDHAAIVADIDMVSSPALPLPSNLYRDPAVSVPSSTSPSTSASTGRKRISAAAAIAALNQPTSDMTVAVAADHIDHIDIDHQHHHQPASPNRIRASTSSRSAPLTDIPPHNHAMPSISMSPSPPHKKQRLADQLPQAQPASHPPPPKSQPPLVSHKLSKPAIPIRECIDLDADDDHDDDFLSTPGDNSAALPPSRIAIAAAAKNRPAAAAIRTTTSSANPTHQQYAVPTKASATSRKTFTKKQTTTRRGFV